MAPGAGECPPERWPADVGASAHIFVESASELVDRLDVTGDDGHHLGRVLRLRAGETVTVADGSGLWRPSRITGIGAPPSTSTPSARRSGSPSSPPASPWPSP